MGRDARSSRGGRANRDNRGIYGSRSESNVPSSLAKTVQPTNIGAAGQKKIILPIKSPQSRNQQLLEEDTQETTMAKPKHASGEFDNSHVTKELESKMANLTS